jgi:hypothetical protein
MEYYVQRHGDQAAFAYSCMSGALVGIVAIVMGIWYLSGKEPLMTIYDELVTKADTPETDLQQTEDNQKDN